MKRTTTSIVFYAILFIVSITIFYIIYKYKTLPHFIPKTVEGPKEINGTPLVIYQSWEDHFVPPKMKQNVLKMLEKNPEFDYYLFDDSESRVFIKENYPQEVVDAFDCIVPGAYKSDLWRYCILYKKGGCYMDIKMTPLVPLTQVLQIQPTIFVKDHIQSEFKMYECIWNGIMISPPGNKIFKQCIDNIVEMVQQHNYGRNALDITGPCLLGRTVKELDGTQFFKLNVLSLTNFKGAEDGFDEKIMHNGKVFFTSYKEYRAEQKMFAKKKHYSVYYKKKQVFMC
jgi:mannosyltransferase OCH1-like enzyme